MNLQEEFERQINNLIQKKYHEHAGKTADELRSMIEPLRKRLKEIHDEEMDQENGYLPFVIVIKSDLVNTETAMKLLQYGRKPGVTKLTPLKPADFEPIAGLNLPEQPVYLAINIERGREYLNVTPHDALISIESRSRSALTIDEGIAAVTQYPEFLMKNNCFSLSGSRHSGDKRVPALWINGKKEANLGWCWDGNPHTWLGSASCIKRVI